MKRTTKQSSTNLSNKSKVAKKKSTKKSTRSSPMKNGEDNKVSFISEKSATNAKDATTKSQIGAELAGGLGSVDKIRDILFGAQMQDYEKRFVRLEERLMQESQSTKEDLKKRFDSLEKYMKNEVESLLDKVKSEQNERTDSVTDILRQIKDLTKTFEKKTGQISDRVSNNQREARSRLLEESKSLREEIAENHNLLSENMNNVVNELRHDKTDRVALANLLTEMALRLTDEFKIPSSKDT